MLKLFVNCKFFNLLAHQKLGFGSGFAKKPGSGFRIQNTAGYWYVRTCHFLDPSARLFCTQSEVLTGNPGQLEDVYESLDPGQHTLACLAVLAARWATPDPCLWLMYPDPGIFVIDLQDANNKLIKKIFCLLLLKPWRYIFFFFWGGGFFLIFFF